MKEALEEEELRYGSDPKWTDWLTAKRKELAEGLRADGFTIADLANKPRWPLLGSYLGTEPRNTSHKNLLRTFTLGDWRAYSEISHASFRGLKELCFISIVTWRLMTCAKNL